MLAEPDLLVVDEPCASLDRGTASEVRSARVLAPIPVPPSWPSPMTALLAETGVADAMVLVREGRTIATGTPGEIRVLADPCVRSCFR
ncbi:hypothetical protein [Amycolatopsis orientalis]|uniref:hypothetical protein n=1 Tax=Amycolatopsis orientalis TaxID=31958 RepID=UPI0003AACF4D|nr:hypothetical protein [Amycolatopsis orientalis]